MVRIHPGSPVFSRSSWCQISRLGRPWWPACGAKSAMAAVVGQVVRDMCHNAACETHVLRNCSCVRKFAKDATQGRLRHTQRSQRPLWWKSRQKRDTGPPRSAEPSAAGPSGCRSRILEGERSQDSIWPMRYKNGVVLLDRQNMLHNCGAEPTGTGRWPRVSRTTT